MTPFWLQEIWKWMVSQLEYWLVMLWWFTAAVFAASAFARWYIGRRSWGLDKALPERSLGWWRTLALGITATWPRDRERLIARFAVRGGEGAFTLALSASQVAPVYALWIIFALGKEYLVVYLMAAAIFLSLVTLASQWLLSFPAERREVEPGRERGRTSFPAALVQELLVLAPRAGYGLVAAAFLSALALHPAWTFPVEITGGGFVAQCLNAVLGVVVAVGAWTPPVGAFLLGVPVWRGGFALAGLLAFFLSVPAAPPATLAYAEAIGRREAGKLAAIVLFSAVLSALLATVLVALLGLALPYQYAAEQTF